MSWEVVDVATSDTGRNKAVIRRFVEEVQNNQDWAAYDELNDPDFVNLSAPPEPRLTARAASSFSRPCLRLTPMRW